MPPKKSTAVHLPLLMAPVKKQHRSISIGSLRSGVGVNSIMGSQNQYAQNNNSNAQSNSIQNGNVNSLNISNTNSQSPQISSQNQNGNDQVNVSESILSNYTINNSHINLLNSKYQNSGHLSNYANNAKAQSHSLSPTKQRRSYLPLVSNNNIGQNYVFNLAGNQQNTPISQPGNMPQMGSPSSVATSYGSSSLLNNQAPAINTLLAPLNHSPSQSGTKGKEKKKIMEDLRRIEKQFRSLTNNNIGYKGAVTSNSSNNLKKNILTPYHIVHSSPQTEESQLTPLRQSRLLLLRSTSTNGINGGGNSNGNSSGNGNSSNNNTNSNNNNNTNNNNKHHNNSISPSTHNKPAQSINSNNISSQSPHLLSQLLQYNQNYAALRQPILVKGNQSKKDNIRESQKDNNNTNNKNKNNSNNSNHNSNNNSNKDINNNSNNNSNSNNNNNLSSHLSPNIAPPIPTNSLNHPFLQIDFIKLFILEQLLYYISKTSSYAGTQTNQEEKNGFCTFYLENSRKDVYAIVIGVISVVKGGDNDRGRKDEFYDNKDRDRLDRNLNSIDNDSYYGSQSNSAESVTTIYLKSIFYEKLLHSLTCYLHTNNLIILDMLIEIAYHQNLPSINQFHIYNTSRFAEDRRKLQGDHMGLLEKNNKCLKEVIKGLLDGCGFESLRKFVGDMLEVVDSGLLDQDLIEEEEHIKTDLYTQTVKEQLGQDEDDNGQDGDNQNQEPIESPNNISDSTQSINVLQTVKLSPQQRTLMTKIHEFSVMLTSLSKILSSSSAREPAPPKPSPPFLPPELPPGKRYTLVLDMDQTLIHYREDVDGSMDTATPNVGNHQPIAQSEPPIRYLTRPYCQDFLNCMAQHYQLVVFTAAVKQYADAILDHLDPQQRISHRLYREHTRIEDYVSIKDLSLLDRDLSKTIIIDNIPSNYKFQPRNGIAIATWTGERGDLAFKNLMPVLKKLVVENVNDVRVGLQVMAEYMEKQIKAGADIRFEELRLNKI